MVTPHTNKRSLASHIPRTAQASAFGAICSWEGLVGVCQGLARALNCSLVLFGTWEGLVRPLWGLSGFMGASPGFLGARQGWSGLVRASQG